MDRFNTSNEHRLPLEPNGPTSLIQDEPIFMQPLLPTRPARDAHPAGPAPPARSSPAAENLFAQSSAFQVQFPTAQVQQMQGQGQDRLPYGSGDSDDGYTLEFPSLEAFRRWRSQLEDTETVEFIKGDTHRSKANPPRFNEHIKLICARHSKNARSKYAGTLPERSRSVPSRKIEGEGCPASISFKTYYDTPIVRAMYFNQHSHPIGRENLPFTRRGRKMAENERKMQQQTGFSRANAVLNGMALTAAQDFIGSKNSEGRNLDTSRSEPPPMASLKPPVVSPKESSVPVGNRQNQNCSDAFQGIPKPLPQDSLSSHWSQETTSNTSVTMQPSPTYEHIQGNGLSHSPGFVWTGAPYTEGSNGYGQAYPPPPPPLARCQDAQVHQPHPTYLMSQPDVQNYQAHYLPTPTTPSSRIQSLHPHPYPQYRPETSSQCEREGLGQMGQTWSASHASPISPVTPNTQNLPGPSINNYASAPQYPLGEQYSFNEDRWNRLETYFQAVRLRARNYVLHEQALSSLESLLSQLYLEGQGQPPYTRPDNEQSYAEQLPYQQ